MSRYPDVAGWILACIAFGMGIAMAWLADAQQFSENMGKAIGYTVIVFASLVMALRPAWRRWRLWGDLAMLLGLHVALVVPVVALLDSRSIRLNWVVALPFVGLELLLFLGVLWRRNIGVSS